jgi:hypothetical protein
MTLYEISVSDLLKVIKLRFKYIQDGMSMGRIHEEIFQDNELSKLKFEVNAILSHPNVCQRDKDTASDYLDIIVSLIKALSE